MSSQLKANCILVDEFRNAVDSLLDSYISTVNSPSSNDSDNLKVSTLMKISISSADQEVRLTLDSPVTDEPVLQAISSSTSSESSLPFTDDSFDGSVERKASKNKKKRIKCHCYKEAKNIKNMSKTSRTRRGRSSLKSFFFSSDLQKRHPYFFHIIYLNCLVKDCSVRVNTLEKLNEHLLGYHQIYKFRCPHERCQMSFSTMRKLFAHFEDVHSYVRIWKCYACQELFDFPMYLYNHIYYEHTYGKFKCGRTECSFAEQTRNKVFRHFHSCSSKKSRR